ncbi:uncharacterized protein LOC110807885 [Carica papaya]|uniref:uncharacterized protein LOC110807885 n=1 Tax=Carica papaya TaxID=3649 RepID=UPI000B8CD079|nr:uncharacterized protein LOC110807885 [Carica papaya]
MTRDAEAVQLLLVGSSPNYRNALFDQLMQDQRDKSFYAALQHNYGQLPCENGHDVGEARVKHRVPERRSTSISQQEQKSDKNSNEARNAKTVPPTTAKPSSLPAQAPPSAEPAKPVTDASHGKNKFFLARWFGFGSK